MVETQAYRPQTFQKTIDRPLGDQLGVPCSPGFNAHRASVCGCCPSAFVTSSVVPGDVAVPSVWGHSGTLAQSTVRDCRSPRSAHGQSPEPSVYSRLSVISRRLRSLPMLLGAAGMSPARAGRVSGRRVAGSRPRSVPARRRRSTRWRRVTFRVARRRPQGRERRQP